LSDLSRGKFGKLFDVKSMKFDNGEDKNNEGGDSKERKGENLIDEDEDIHPDWISLERRVKNRKPKSKCK
jgi:hypothetical protein